MVNISKSGNAIKFEFTDSDHYLYGDGVVEVPVNSLSLVIDESKFVVFKKAATNDTFITFDPANSNLSDKAGVIEFFKTSMVGSTGGGGDVTVDPTLDSGSTNPVANSAITTALNAKADTTLVNQIANEAEQAILSISGDVQTKVGISDFNAYSAATATALGNKYDKVSGVTIDYDSENQTPQVTLQVEDENGGIHNVLIDNWGVDAYINDEETGHNTDAYISNEGSMGVYEHTEGQEGDEDEGMTYDKSIGLHPDRLELNDTTEGDGYNKSDTVMITKDVITMNKSVSDGQDETISSIIIDNNSDGQTYIRLTDTDGNGVGINPLMLSWQNSEDGDDIEWNQIAKKNDIDAAVSGKADTSAVTAAIDAATSGKVDTSAITSAITSGSTDAEIPTAKAVYDATQGGGVTVDPTLDSGSTNPVANSAITAAIDEKANKTAAVGGYVFGNVNNVDILRYRSVDSSNIGNEIYFPKINGKGILTSNGIYARNNYNFQLVETSAITTSMNSSSTDAQVPSAKAVYDTLGGLKLVSLTQSEYDNLATKDANTLYIINNVVS